MEASDKRGRANKDMQASGKKISPLTNDRFSVEPKNTTYLKLYTRCCFNFQNPLPRSPAPPHPLPFRYIFSNLKPGSSRKKGTSKHSKGQNSLAGKIACEKQNCLFSCSPLTYPFLLSFFKAQTK